MGTEYLTIEVLGYLKRKGPTNTFRLATELSIDRHKLLNIIRKLEEKESVNIQTGNVTFLKFPAKEKEATKKPIKTKKVSRLRPKEFKEKISELELDIKQQSIVKNKLKEQAEHIKELENTIEELYKKANASPKIIRRTVIEKVPVRSRKLKEQAEQINKLEKKIKELKQIPPKIIRRTIVKKVPNIIRKTVTKKVYVKVKEKPKPRFKLPKINLAWMKNIQELNTPMFIDQKINMKKPNINFAGPNKNIHQLHIPETFKMR